MGLKDFVAFFVPSLIVDFIKFTLMIAFFGVAIDQCKNGYNEGAASCVTSNADQCKANAYQDSSDESACIDIVQSAFIPQYIGIAVWGSAIALFLVTCGCCCLSEGGLVALGAILCVVRIPVNLVSWIYMLILKLNSCYATCKDHVPPRIPGLMLAEIILGGIETLIDVCVICGALLCRS
jgi:hypothetical protein